MQKSSQQDLEDVIILTPTAKSRELKFLTLMQSRIPCLGNSTTTVDRFSLKT